MLAANITPVHSSPETESTTVEQANTTEELLPIQVSGWRTWKTNPVWKHFAPLHTYTSQPAITSATHLFVSCAETAVQTAQLNWEMAQALAQQD